MSEQRSVLIQYRSPSALKAHKANGEIYGPEDLGGLVQSVQELGVMQTLYTKHDGTIISGHRRWKAALAAGLADIPCVDVSFGSADEEERAIIEHNRYRDKTLGQLANEAERLQAIFERAAKSRQRSLNNRQLDDNACAKTAQALNGKARDDTAKAIGVSSGQQVDRLLFLKAEADKGNAEAQKQLQTRNRIGTAAAAVKKSIKIACDIERLKTIEPPTGAYQVIVVDPPWEYSGRKQDPTHRARNPYPAMTQEELKAFAIPAVDDAVLWLWTTNAFLPNAFELVNIWGFQYKTMLTWAKDRMGLGDWLRGKTEHCLMAVRGKYRVELTNQTTLLNAAVGEHSEKPAAFYNMVDALCPGTARIDMFARSPRDGWQVWGAGLE